MNNREIMGYIKFFFLFIILYQLPIKSIFFVAIRNYNKSEKIDALLRDYLLDCFYLRLDSISILFVTSKNKDSPQDSYHRNTKKQNMTGSQCDSYKVTKKLINITVRTLEFEKNPSR